MFLDLSMVPVTSEVSHTRMDGWMDGWMDDTDFILSPFLSH